MLSTDSSRLRALIYNRVSADPSGQRISVESQDAENRAFCDQRNWDVAAVVTDNDRSASRHAVREREGYRQVQDGLDGSLWGRIDVLVCWESSRSQRDLADYVDLRGLCTRHGVLLAYKGRVYDLARGDDRFTTGLDALLAEREAEEIRERIMRGIRTRAAQGAPHGTVPFGFRREYDAHTGALLRQVPDEITAPIAREIIARVIGGVTLYELAADLNRRGAVTPQQYKDTLAGRDRQRWGWTSSKIRRLIASRSIIGVRTHNQDVHDQATWEPLVSAADYELARLILADPHRARHHRGVQPRYLLSGIAECGVCGAWMRPATNRGRSVYQCAGRANGSGKGHVVCSRDPLDAMVVTAMLERLSRPDALATMATAAADEDAAVAAREVSALRARLADLERAAAEGELTAGAFGRIEADVRGRLADAQHRAMPRTVSPIVAGLAAPDADRRWEILSIEGQREAIRALLTVTVRHSVRTRGVHGFDPSRVEVTFR